MRGNEEKAYNAVFEHMRLTGLSDVKGVDAVAVPAMAAETVSHRYFKGQAQNFIYHIEGVVVNQMLRCVLLLTMSSAC